MKVKKMRTKLPFYLDVDGIKKVSKVLQNVDGEMQVIHDFRQYLIKDGVLQNGCNIVREKLTAPKQENGLVASEGYVVGYEEMLAKGELVREEGALKVILPKLNVGNTVMPIIVQNLFIYSEESVGNEAYKSNKMYAEVAYHSEGDEYWSVKRIRLNSEIEIRPSAISAGYSLNKTSDSTGLNEISFEEKEAYGLSITYGTPEDTIFENEVLYIKDVYIIA